MSHIFLSAFSSFPILVISLMTNSCRCWLLIQLAGNCGSLMSIVFTLNCKWVEEMWVPWDSERKEDWFSSTEFTKMAFDSRNIRFAPCWAWTRGLIHSSHIARTARFHDASAEFKSFGFLKFHIKFETFSCDFHLESISSRTTIQMSRTTNFHISDFTFFPRFQFSSFSPICVRRKETPQLDYDGVHVIKTEYRCQDSIDNSRSVIASR